MKDAREINGFYGSGRTRTKVFIYGRWYAAKGSINVNRTPDDIQEGTDIEELEDYDSFTWSKPINSLRELIKAVES